MCFMGKGQDIRIVQHSLSLRCFASQSQVYLWLIHLCVVRRLANELRDDVTFCVEDSLAGALSVSLGDLAAVGKNARV